MQVGFRLRQKGALRNEGKMFLGEQWLGGWSKTGVMGW